MSGLAELSTKLKQCEIDEDDAVAELVEVFAGFNLALDGHLSKGFVDELFSDAGKNYAPLYFSIGIARQGRGFEYGGAHGDADDSVVTNCDVIPLPPIFGAFAFVTARKLSHPTIAFDP